VRKADAVGVVTATDVKLIKSDNSSHTLHTLFAECHWPHCHVPLKLIEESSPSRHDQTRE
jgi:hypothetical protein